MNYLTKNHENKYKVDQITVSLLRDADVKFNRLCALIEQYTGLVVAFSGGVDSTFLIKVASELLGEKAIALTVISPYIAQWEIEEARQLTNQLGINHRFIEVGIPDEIKTNPVNRCYLCKGKIFSTIKSFASEIGINVVADGSNFDDTKDYRPGMKALVELDIQSPLMLCEVTKDEIRAWSKLLELETWNKPPYACLLTRLPYDTLVDVSELRMIEAAEAYLIGIGIRAVRVRKHGAIARIEVETSEIEKVFNIKTMREISDKIKSFGFEYVTLDLEGYTMGSFNRNITK